MPEQDTGVVRAHCCAAGLDDILGAVRRLLDDAAAHKHALLTAIV